MLSNTQLAEFFRSVERFARDTAEAVAAAPAAHGAVIARPPIPSVPPKPRVVRAESAAASAPASIMPDAVSDYCLRMQLPRSASVFLMALCRHAGWQTGRPMTYQGAQAAAGKLGLSVATAYRAQALLLQLGVLELTATRESRFVSLKPMSAWTQERT